MAATTARHIAGSKLRDGNSIMAVHSACDGNSIVMSWQWRQQRVQQPSDLKNLIFKKQ